MAIDEWLTVTGEIPVLRSYRWTPGWGSFGYFVKVADLNGEGMKWVRRWTGGGIVDHRDDWTYTLFVPRGHDLAEERGGGSYRSIHSALVTALNDYGTQAKLAGPLPPAAGGECFVQPVEHDILDSSGRKIAGAGQRRTSKGLLHQGSVVTAGRAEVALAEGIAKKVVAWEGKPDLGWIEQKVVEKYGAEEWFARR